MTLQPSFVIKAEQLTKQVKSGDELLTILKDVNLNVARAETLAITGPSGSGKSTLLSLLAGIDTPNAGHIWLNGEDLTQLDEDGRALLRAKYVGFVFQNFHLLPSLTALENVMLPLELADSSNAKELAQEYLFRVGLNKRLQHYPKQLSGGEQQRVAIARAFVIQPQILFADEITGNLDNKTAANIIDLLFQLNAEHQTTLILVTHEEKLAQRCDRHVEITNGVLINGKDI